MCEKCEKLLNVPKNKKAITILHDGSAIDADIYKINMVLDHDIYGNPKAFIKQEVVISSTGRSYGTPIYINFCPFCGERLY